MSLFEINLLAEILAAGNSSRSSAFQLMSKFTQVGNDNGWPDDKVFRGKRDIRAVCRRRNKQ